MQWFTLVSTVVGGLLAIGATVTADRLRWSRERAKAVFDTRRHLYSDYLADLTATRDAIRAVGRGLHSDGISRREAAVEAFSRANPYSRRYQISITAPEPVVTAATDTFRRLRELRDVVAEGHDRESEPYATARAKYEASLSTLIEAMRRDLAPVTGLSASTA